MVNLNNKNNNIFFDNLVYLIFFTIVLGLTIIHNENYLNFKNNYEFQSDNKNYYLIVTKLESIFSGYYYDISNSDAIPGLAFLIFFIKKILFSTSIYYSFFLLMLISYFLTLNLIRNVFSSYTSFLSLILGWEFVVASTTGGTEPVISFLIILSIYYFLKNKIKISLTFVMLGALVKPFVISMFAAYGIIFLYEKKYFNILLILLFGTLTIIIFFLMSYIIYNENTTILLENTYEKVWTNDEQELLVPISIFFKSMFNTIHKFDHTIKTLFFIFLILMSLSISLFNKKTFFRYKKNQILFFVILFYFLIIFIYPSHWGYYEFVRFISPVVPISVYLLFEIFEIRKKFIFGKQIFIYPMLLLSAIFYSYANVGIKDSLGQFINNYLLK